MFENRILNIKTFKRFKEARTNAARVLLFNFKDQVDQLEDQCFQNSYKHQYMDFRKQSFYTRSGYLIKCVKKKSVF